MNFDQKAPSVKNVYLVNYVFFPVYPQVVVELSVFCPVSGKTNKFTSPFYPQVIMELSVVCSVSGPNKKRRQLCNLL